MAALSGASPDEANQVFVILGFAGEHCRFGRPARSLTVKGDDREHVDAGWLILKVEEAFPEFPRETIRFIQRK